MRITDAHIHFWTPDTFAYQMNKEPPQTGDPEAVKTTWNFLPRRWSRSSTRPGARES